MLKGLAFVWLAMHALGTSAVAQEKQSNAVTFFAGECRFQILQGFFPCDSGVMWAEFGNGRAQVSFFKEGTAFLLAGGHDRQPDLENYYLSIDTVRVLQKGKPDQTGSVEGECHFRLNKEGTKFYFIRCDVYNRKVGFIWKFYLDNIKNFDRKLFPPSSATSKAQEPPDVSSSAAGSVFIPLQDEGGTYLVPVLINKAITLNFVLDSGAADVSVPADVVMTLIRTGTLQESDFIGTQTYKLADGSMVPSTTFRIRSLTVGNTEIQNVAGSVAPVAGSLLLGQSFLAHFQSWSINNARKALVLGPIAGAK